MEIEFYLIGWLFFFWTNIWWLLFVNINFHWNL